jgi:hypothetical protein
MVGLSPGICRPFKNWTELNRFNLVLDGLNKMAAENGLPLEYSTRQMVGFSGHGLNTQPFDFMV